MDQEIIIRFLLAALWGGIVGAEREYRSKSAGFRTMIMISIGACFFTMISAYIGGAANPDRIAANIVSGIGFLGAGVIFQGDNRMSGITTAATIWAVAAVGMGIGAGHYFASAVACVLIIIILTVLPFIEGFIDRMNQSRVYTVDCKYSQTSKSDLENVLRRHNLKFRAVKEIKNESDLSITWHVQGRSKNHEQFIHEVINLPLLKRFEY